VPELHRVVAETRRYVRQVSHDSEELSRLESQPSAQVREAAQADAAESRPAAPATSTIGSTLIQAGVALAAALVAVLYPIGYTLLVARLAITYTHSLPAAWYAASLVPVANVVGQVFGLPFLLTVASTAIVLIIEQLPKPRRKIQVSRRGTWIAVAVYVLALGAMLAVSRDVALIAGVVTGTVTGVGFGLLEDLGKRRRIPTLTRWGALVGLLYIVLTSISLLPPTDPSNVLPQVRIGAVSTAGTRLLAHVDGYWYVFTPDGVLHAVPDSQAGAPIIQP